MRNGGSSEHEHISTVHYDTHKEIALLQEKVAVVVSKQDNYQVDMTEVKDLIKSLSTKI